ncbi:MAG: hypothetical protein M1835_004625 [Candelina submexicana]|nr:MAG: hypothetical protein M1835_004625 [Candelina submexicana]
MFTVLFVWKPRVRHYIRPLLVAVLVINFQDVSSLKYCLKTQQSVTADLSSFIDASLKIVPELDDHTYLTALPRGTGRTASETSTRGDTPDIHYRDSDGERCTFVPRDRTSLVSDSGSPADKRAKGDHEVLLMDSSSPPVDDIAVDTCLVVSASTKDRAQILRLDGINNAKALQNGILDLWGLKIGSIESVSVLYRWWSDKALEFRLDNTADFEFLRERVEKYDGSKGNCVVEFCVKVKEAGENEDYVVVT